MEGGGGGDISNLYDYFFKIWLACVDNFFFKSSLALFFQKSVGERGGGGRLTFFQDTKKRDKKNFRTNIMLKTFFAPISSYLGLETFFLTPLLISKNVLFSKFGGHPFTTYNFPY